MTTTAKPARPKHRKPYPPIEPGKRHEITIPNWRPATVNQIYGNGPRWWQGAKLKKRDRQVVAAFLPPEARVDPSRPVKRRVRLVLTFAKGERRPDKDNVWKSVLDALRHAGGIWNDSPDWCGYSEPEMVRTSDGTSGTIVILEDI